MSSSSSSFDEQERLIGTRDVLSWSGKIGYFVNVTLLGKSRDDDAVSLGVKRLCFILTICTSLWLLSFLLVMTDVILGGRYVPSSLWLFVPMWLGSALGCACVVAISLNVCRNATLVSPERRLFMRAQGSEGSEAWASARFIDYDSLPLMRRLFCWNLVLLVTFLLALVAQVLFSLWFTFGLIGLWHALGPVLVLGAAYIAFVYAVDVVSPKACVVITLLAIQLVRIDYLPLQHTFRAMAA